MLNNKPIIPFLSTVDPERSKAFYHYVLGLPIKSTDGFATMYDANGTNLRITTVRELTPQAFSVMSWEVEDIEAIVSALESRGVHFEIYDYFQQEPSGVWIAPGGTKVAWFKDPDGNLLSLTQFA